MANQDNQVAEKETTKAATKAATKKLTKIYSQASNDFVVPTYEKKEDAKIQSSNVIESAIIIKGGANVAFSAANKTQRNTKWAITEVDADQLATLKDNKGFMRRVKRGFISIDQEPSDLKMDKSAQITEKQMKAKSKAKPKTGPVDE